MHWWEHSGLESVYICKYKCEGEQHIHHKMKIKNESLTVPNETTKHVLFFFFGVTSEKDLCLSGKTAVKPLSKTASWWLQIWVWVDVFSPVWAAHTKFTQWSIRTVNKCTNLIRSVKWWLNWGMHVWWSAVKTGLQHDSWEQIGSFLSHQLIVETPVITPPPPTPGALHVCGGSAYTWWLCTTTSLVLLITVTPLVHVRVSSRMLKR